MDKQKLLSLLKSRSFKEGKFHLASGEVSDYYIDIRMTTISSEGGYLIGKILYEITKDLNFDSVGGLQVGSVPITSSIVRSYHDHRRLMEGFWVRDTVKSHGTKKSLEGNILPNSRVIIVDDVLTSGQSTLKAINSVRGIGCEVVMVVGIVDRLCGARELLASHDINNYKTKFTIDDFKGVKFGDDPESRIL